MIFAPGSGMRHSGLPSRLTLPKEWPRSIKAALVHVISLANYACKCAWANGNQGAKTDQRDLEIALCREELRLKDARMSRFPAHQRPHYQPTERLAILELRAARGWSLAQTANVFQVTTATIASWTKRLDEQGPDALLRVPVPVNKFPEFVTYIVQRLQTLCPRLGKVKIAQMLARAGLHLGVSTIGHMRRQPPASGPVRPAKTMPSARRVTAKYPNHLWHVDLTTVP